MDHKHKTKVSVVLTLYNGSKYIVEQLDSIRDQTYQSVEVIIADDCSTDDGPKIVQHYIEENHLDSMWRFIQNASNKGYSKNFLDTCAEATGEIIFFSDQDDMWELDKIERMTDVLNSNPQIQVLSSSLMPFYVEDGARKFEQKFLENMKDDGTVEVLSTSEDTFHCRRSGCTMCIRKAFYDEIMPFWIAGWAHDEFAWKMSCVADGCGVYHKNTTNRRMHLNNATNIKERTRAGRISQLKEMRSANDALLAFANRRHIEEPAIAVIEKYGRSLKLRERLLRTRNPVLWLPLLTKYSKCYPRRKGLYLDLYLVFFSVCKKN